MRRVRLTREEKKIEEALIKGEYRDVRKTEFVQIAEAVAHRRKDAVLNIRINSDDLKAIKKKAKKYGIKYQTFIAEMIHRVAHS